MPGTSGWTAGSGDWRAGRAVWQNKPLNPTCPAPLSLHGVSIERRPRCSPPAFGPLTHASQQETPQPWPSRSSSSAWARSAPRTTASSSPTRAPSATAGPSRRSASTTRRRTPRFIEVNSERAQYWLGVGAQPTEPVVAILKVTGDWQKFKGLPGAEGTLRPPSRKADKRAAYDAAARRGSRRAAAPRPRRRARPRRPPPQPEAQGRGAGGRGGPRGRSCPPWPRLRRPPRRPRPRPRRGLSPCSPRRWSTSSRASSTTPTT